MGKRQPPYQTPSVSYIRDPLPKIKHGDIGDAVDDGNVGEDACAEDGIGVCSGDDASSEFVVDALLGFNA